MRLGQRLTLLFLLLAILSIGLVGYLAYENSRRTIIEGTIKHLASINIHKSDQLRRWIGSNRNGLEELAQRPLLRSYAEALRKHDAQGFIFQKAKQGLIEDHLKPRLKYRNFIELFLICPVHGLILASTDMRQEGKYRNRQPYYLEGKIRTYVQNIYYSPGLEQPSMTVSTPITDKQGHLLGVLAGRLDLGELSRIMAQRPVQSRSEDTYLVNTFNFFVTEPRFGKGYALKKSIHTDGVEAGISGKNGTSFYKNYRGEAVAGAFHWLPDFNLAILTEIEQAEAFEPVNHLARIIVGIALVISLGAGLLGLFFAGTITRPIRKLSEGAQKIGEGNLDVRVGITTRDEIGQFSRVMDQMAENLKKITVARNELLKEVEKRRQAEEIIRKERDFSQTALDSLPGLFYLFDDQGRFLRWNKNFERVSGYSPKEISGISPLDLFEEPDRGAVAEKIEEVFLKGEAFTEACFVSKDRSRTPYFFSGRRLLVDQKPCLVGMGIDITELKRVEEALREKDQELEKRNEDLTRFLYAVSHDLKSPLVTIQTFLGYLEKDSGDQEAGRMQEDMRYIHIAADKMSQLLDELLNLSRIGRMMNPSVKEDLQTTVKEALHLVAGQIAEREVEIRITEEPIQLHGDRPRLVEVFQNLIDNAVKFMGDQPVPRIEIGAEETGDEWIIFVRDNGIGIDPRYQPKLFGLFEKLDPRTQGAGIGLALVRRIIEVHGGRIWVESEGVGQGATFKFTLAGTGKAQRRSAFGSYDNNRKGDWRCRT